MGRLLLPTRSIVHWSNTREQEYCSLSWENLETIVDDDGIPIYSVWESSTAYDDWYPANGDTTYKGILFDLGNDDGLYNPENERSSIEEISSDKQYYFNHEDRKIVLVPLAILIQIRLPLELV